MTPRKVSKKLVAGVAATSAAGLVATGLLLGSGTSAAAPVSLTLNYTCPFPLIGEQPIKVVIQSDMPAEIGVGQQTGVFDIKATATVPETATQGLTLVGATSIEGSAVSGAKVDAPGISLPVNVPVKIASTPVPASGAFDVVAVGQTPSLSFTQAGTAKITVSELNLKMTPRKADGTETGLGTFDSACKLNPGQANLLHQFEIKGGPGSTTPPPASSTTPPPASSTTPPPASSTTPPPASSTTPPPSNGVNVNYDLKGSANLTALNGSVAINGTFNAVADLAAGKYTGDLKLAPTSGKFKIAGFLPVDANVSLVPVGKSSGTVATGAITYESKLDIILTKISAFGFPIYQGDTCKAPNPTDLKLKSVGTFDVLKGGKIQGKFDLASPTNCGQLNDFIGPLAASPNNPIDLDLVIKK